MKTRTLAAVALAPMLALAACDDVELNNPTTTNSTATIRFVNATGTSLDVAENGLVASGNGNLMYGGASSCFTVNANDPQLSIRNAGTSTTLSGLTTNFTNGGVYTILAYPGASGTTQFAVLPTNYTPATGQAGLRIFNASTGTYDVYTAASGASFVTPSVTSIGTGTTSTWFDVAPGANAQLRLSTAGTTTSALTLGNLTWTAGQAQTLVIAPPATGSTTLRTFLVSGC
jgi:hypothetical protein